ncbi:MAG TPA: hypothetical protein VFS02_05130 [Telluria sp.]|nr:hypothetical protein [Telluria sp.]
MLDQKYNHKLQTPNTKDDAMNAKAEMNHIATLDLGPIKAKLMEKDGAGWTRQRADAVEAEYRRFLCVAKMYPNEEMAPLNDVDIFWHHHILDTMRYAADCQLIFGYFLHHSPQSGPRSEADEARHEVMGARMQQLYHAIFGEASRIAAGGHAAKAWSAAGGVESAYCQMGVAASPSPRTDCAYCQLGVSASAPSPTDTAYCQLGVATASVRQADTAYCQVGVAYCQVAVATACARRTDTAYCQAGVAYCQVGAATSVSCPGEVAYCQLGATSKPDQESVVPVAQSAWRQAISSTSAVLRQVAASPQLSAQNSSVYASRQAFAQAA